MNRDAKPDLLLQLIKDLPATDNRHRALLVLARMENGALRRIAAADRLLFCTNCFGALAGPDGGLPDVKISNGVTVVNPKKRISAPKTFLEDVDYEKL